MPVDGKKIVDEVLLLPTDARVSLVEQLLTSLNLPTQPGIDRLWAKEAERRIAKIDKGKGDCFLVRRCFRTFARSTNDEILFSSGCK